MTTKALAEEQPKEKGPEERWHAPQETAPSAVAADELLAPRVIGFVSLMLFVLGFMSILFNRWGRPVIISETWGSFFFVIGLAGLLYHASRETLVEMRRMYGVTAALSLLVAVGLAVYPVNSMPGGMFLPYAPLFLIMALLFFLPFVRNETDANLRLGAMYALGGVGVALAGTGLFGGTLSTNFLLSHGLLLSLLGLAFLWAFIGLQGTETELGYRAGLGVGLAGFLVFAIALVRSGLLRSPTLSRWVGLAPDPTYLVAAGVLLMIVGFLYMALALGLCSESKLVVMTRRELSAFFYSPIAYIVLFGFALVGWLQFWIFVGQLQRTAAMEVLPEPIVGRFFLAFIPAMTLIVIVPLLTMRLFSEERRTGTLEVLLTAPVEEVPVVLSKFLGALIFFMLGWLPYGLFLVALRVEGGQPFDYRPLISFFIGLVCSAGGFLSMGLFFSCLTRNQIAAAVMTTLGMLVLFSFYLVQVFMQIPPGLETVLRTFSFIDLWAVTLQGQLALRDLIFHVSVTIFWLFLTIKVLEARKWS